MYFINNLDFTLAFLFVVALLVFFIGMAAIRFNSKQLRKAMLSVFGAFITVGVLLQLIELQQFMDATILGSALTSGTGVFASEFMVPSTMPIELTVAPFLLGLLAAVVAQFMPKQAKVEAEYADRVPA